MYSPVGMPRDLAGGKCGLYDAHHTPPHLQREQVGGDCKHDGADDAAEQAGHDSGQEQQGIVRRERAESGADDEAGIEEKEESLSIEPVGEAGCQKAGDAGAEGVGRHDLAKSLRTDFEVGHDDRAERRYDHEVQDDGELQEREQRDDELLVAGEFQPRGSVRFGNGTTIAGLDICCHRELASALGNSMAGAFPAVLPSGRRTPGKKGRN